MKVDILCAARRLRSFEQEWIDDYLSRIRPFAEISFHRIKEKSRDSPETTAAATWKEFENKIPDRTMRVLLDSTGKLLSTSQFSEIFDRPEKAGKGRVTFIVGGSYGLPAEAKRSADLLLSLTPLTLPHRLATLVLVEQIYRALSWRAGSPYHHE